MSSIVDQLIEHLENTLGIFHEPEVDENNNVLRDELQLVIIDVRSITLSEMLESSEYYGPIRQGENR